MGLAIEGNDRSVYKAYIRDINSLKDLVLFFLFGESNKLNPGPILNFLSILTIVEGVLITCVYIYL